MREKINLVVGMQNGIWIHDMFLGLNRQYLMTYWILGKGVDKEKKEKFSM